MTYLAGMNVVGDNPESQPAEFSSLDEAKRHLVNCIKAEESSAESEDEAETLCHFAEDINLESELFTAECLGKLYWVRNSHLPNCPFCLSSDTEQQGLAWMEIDKYNGQDADSYKCLTCNRKFWV